MRKILAILFLLFSAGIAEATCLLQASSTPTFVLGPFVDSTDGFTAETGLTISQADVRLSKNGAAFAQKNDATACTHMENGYYSCPLNATDTGTGGQLTVAVNETGALPVWRECLVLAASAYDALQGSGAGFRGNVITWNSTTVATPDTAGYPKVTIKDGTGTGEINTDTGRVGLNWADVGSQSTSVNLSATTVNSVTSVVNNVPANVSNSGTAQAGCALPCATLTLAAGAAAADDSYKDQVLQLTGGAAAGQSCRISTYNGTTKVATCSANWPASAGSNPDATTTYRVIGDGPVSATVSGNVTVGAYAAGQDPATYILTTPANTLVTDASGRVQVQAGTGAGQVDLSSGRVKDDKPAVGRLALKKGTTSYLGTIYIEDQRTGGPLTGLAFNTASLTMYHIRADQGNTNAEQCTLATATRGTFTSSGSNNCGFVEKDATNTPGWYELSVANNILATGSSWAAITLKGAANMKPATMFIELVDNTVADISTTLGTPAGASVSADIASVQTDTNDIQTRLPAALVGGRMDSDIGAISTDATAANNLESLLDGTGGVTLSGTLSGSVGSVAAGGITSATFAAGAIDAAAIAADALTAAKVAADVGAEIAAATTGATLSELSQATPSATPTLAQAIMLMYMALRNQTDTTSGQISYTNDAGTVVVKCTLADNGTTFTKSECVAGP